VKIIYVDDNVVGVALKPRGKVLKVVYLNRPATPKPPRKCGTRRSTA
jgi:hypothetical protein